jgi:hypothetical protein
VYTSAPPETDAACEPLVPQLIEYQLPVTVTASLNVRLTFASTATFVAPSAGELPVTLGGSSLGQKLSGVSALRGDGGPLTKSAPLLSVSVQPPLRRNAEVVLLSAGAGAPPSK